MRSLSLPCVVAVVLAAFATVQAAQAATQYHLVPLGLGSSASAINRSGEIGGSSVVYYQAALYKNGVWIPRDVSGAELVSVTGIDNRGGMVGLVAALGPDGYLVDEAVYWAPTGKPTVLPLPASTVPGAASIGDAWGVAPNGEMVVGDVQIDNVQACFTWAKGATSVVLFNEESCEALGINAQGTVVGYYAPVGQPSQGFVYANARMTPVGLLPSAGASGHSLLMAINDRGQAVGYASYAPDGADTHAVSWNGKALSDLGALPGDNNSQAYAINDRGDVVGRSWSSIGSRPFLYTGGQMVDLQSAIVDDLTGWSELGATGINAQGVIVGTGQIGTGANMQYQGFMLVPVSH